MKVLVCGDRNWTNRDAIKRVLSGLPEGTIVVHGDARGVDSLAGEVATELGFSVIAVPANWAVEGLLAGPIRNQRMLDEHPDCEHVFAFHADIAKSKGTKDMIHRAVARGVDYTLVEN